MGPMSHAERHDVPWLELVPGVAAVIRDVVVACEYPFVSYVSRTICLTFSAGFSSAHFGGGGTAVMLLGTISLADICQTA